MEQEEDLIVDKQYLKGFNQGYVLAEHTPELISTLLKNELPANEYFTGFKAGNQEYSMEKVRARSKSINKDSPATKSVSKDKGKSK